MNKGISEAIDYAIKSKRFIGGLGRVKKDGRVAKINGQIFLRKVSRAGNAYILVDNFLGKVRKGTNKRWQIILEKNIVQLNENRWEHIRRSA
jgi:hypothetical protein